MGTALYEAVPLFMLKVESEGRSHHAYRPFSL